MLLLIVLHYNLFQIITSVLKQKLLIYKSQDKLMWLNQIMGYVVTNMTCCDITIYDTYDIKILYCGIPICLHSLLQIATQSTISTLYSSYVAIAIIIIALFYAVQSTSWPALPAWPVYSQQCLPIACIHSMLYIPIQFAMPQQSSKCTIVFYDHLASS